jgi:hypothetical protein
MNSVHGSDGQCRGRCGGEDTGAAGGGFTSAASPLSIGLGLGWWGTVAAVNLVSRVVVPTSYLWRCATGAHQPPIGLGSPDQGAVKGPVGLWANR